MKRIAIAYLRVSTAQQVDDGDSLAAQRSAAEQFAEQRGYRLANCFADPGKSGRSKRGRTALTKALAKVKAVKGVLIVRSLSRLARSVIDLHTILSELHGSGADLACINESIDTTTAAGRAFFGFLAVMAQFESDLISDRLREAYAYRRNIGDPIASGLPRYGWKRKKGSKELEVDAPAQANLALMRGWWQQGFSLAEIAAKLDKMGIPPPDRHWGRRSKNHATAKWRGGTVGNLLRRMPGHEHKKPKRS